MPTSNRTSLSEKIITGVVNANQIDRHDQTISAVGFLAARSVVEEMHDAPNLLKGDTV